ncbi:hypothetical protein [Botrimarina sp.]|uniref:hypothetical protein n=1 Tax=Botrimarina sp. TaxID=2795802 RepID=UPI0032EEF2FB
MSVLCNELSGERIVVGSTCVKRVLGIDAPAIDRSLDAIERDPLRSVNKAILDVAFDGGWITRYEFDFYCNTRSKRKLTPKQEAFKRKVNGKILRGLVADEELQVG